MLGHLRGFSDTSFAARFWRILVSTASLVELKALDAATPADARAKGSVDAATDAGADNGAGSKAEAPKTGLIVFLGGKRMIAAAVVGAGLTLVWLTLFTLGLCVNTEPYRTRLTWLAGPPAIAQGDESQAARLLEAKIKAVQEIDVLYALLAVAFTYTPTNLLLMCCASALIGCLGRLATTNGNNENGNGRGASQSSDSSKSAEDSDPTGVSPLAPAMSAVMWGFFVYLVLISGTIVLAGDTFMKTDADQYFRLAGSASLLAFAVGWQPQLVTHLVSNIGSAKLGRSGKTEKSARA